MLTCVREVASNHVNNLQQLTMAVVRGVVTSGAPVFNSTTSIIYSTIINYLGVMKLHMLCQMDNDQEIQDFTPKQHLKLRVRIPMKRRRRNQEDDEEEEQQLTNIVAIEITSNRSLLDEEQMMDDVKTLLSLQTSEHESNQLWYIAKSVINGYKLPNSEPLFM
jgi:hypothetical protein